MFSFFPKNDEFFHLFERHASNMDRAAELVLELCKEPNRKVELAGAIREIEHRCDKITRDCLKLLVRTFITPFEREDIHALISTMDDVVDYMENATTCFLTFQLEEPIDEFKAQAEFLKRATELVVEAVDNIKNQKTRTKVLAQVYKIYDIESKADGSHDGALARLYSETNDYNYKFVMKWTNLCEDIEGAIDACQKVGNTLEMIVLKEN